MTDVIIPSLKVNPEFQTLIPPLADDEYKRLETSLINNGWEGWRGPIRRHTQRRAARHAAQRHEEVLAHRRVGG